MTHILAIHQGAPFWHADCCGPVFGLTRSSDPAGLAAFAESWAKDRRFVPKMATDEQDRRYARWQRAGHATMAA